MDLKQHEREVWYYKPFNVSSDEIPSINSPIQMEPSIPINRGILLNKKKTRTPVMRIYFPPDCLSFDTSYWSFGDYRDISHIPTAEACQDECADDDECKLWEWVDANAHFNPPEELPGQIEHGNKGKCYLKTGKGVGGIRTAAERVT